MLRTATAAWSSASIHHAYPRNGAFPVGVSGFSALRIRGIPDGPAVECPVPPPPSAIQHEGMRPTVLMVDDHKGFRTRARVMLEAEGFDVVAEAATGADGVGMATRLRPD